MKKLAIIKYGKDANAESYLKAIKRRLGEEYVEVYDLDVISIKDIDGIYWSRLYPSNMPCLVLEPIEKEVRDLFSNNLETKGKYPITPTAIFRKLKEMTDLEGKTVCILNRTERIGKPLANMLIGSGATVTVCNSKTDSEVLKHMCFCSDIVITATNGKETFKPRSHQIVVDVSNDLTKYKNETIRFKYISTSEVGRWTLDELERRMEEQ